MATINGKAVVHSASFMVRAGDTIEIAGPPSVVIRIAKSGSHPTMTMKAENGVVYHDIAGFDLAHSRVSTYEWSTGGVDYLGAVSATRVAEQDGIISYQILTTLNLA